MKAFISTVSSMEKVYMFIKMEIDMKVISLTEKRMGKAYIYAVKITPYIRVSIRTINVMDKVILMVLHFIIMENSKTTFSMEKAYFKLKAINLCMMVIGKLVNVKDVEHKYMVITKSIPVTSKTI